MKKLFFLLLLIPSLIFSSDNIFEKEFSVVCNRYAFSSYFDFISKEQHMGRAISDSFHLKTHYNYYNPEGELEIHSTCRFLSLGLFFSWATEIDVYSQDGIPLGIIDGKFLTTEPAKFCFFNSSHELIAYAYLDQYKNCFSIVDSQNSDLLLAQLVRHSYYQPSSQWHVRIFESEQIDPRILYIFSAFICDQQDNF